MRFLRIIPVLILILVLQHYVSTPNGAGPGPQPSQGQSSSSETDVSGPVPKKALQVLDIVRQTGQAPEGYVGGRVFQNREGRLPQDGEYREFDVDPHDGNRNAERIIVEWQTKKAWYTGDHYQTFIPLP